MCECMFYILCVLLSFERHTYFPCGTTTKVVVAAAALAAQAGHFKESWQNHNMMTQSFDIRVKK